MAVAPPPINEVIVKAPRNMVASEAEDVKRVFDPMVFVVPPCETSAEVCCNVLGDGAFRSDTLT